MQGGLADAVGVAEREGQAEAEAEAEEEALADRVAGGEGLADADAVAEGEMGGGPTKAATSEAEMARAKMRRSLSAPAKSLLPLAHAAGSVYEPYATKDERMPCQGPALCTCTKTDV